MKNLKQAIKIINETSDDIDEIFIRPITKKEKGNPTHRDSFYAIPEKEGYEKVYKPYGDKGKGYYYVKKAQQMKPEILEGDWVTIDGPMGGESLPLDLVDEEEVKELIEAVEQNDHAEVSLKGTGLELYFENKEIYSIEIVRGGFGARFSMPGYLDRTEWTVFATREEAEEYLKEQDEMYEKDEEE